MPYPVPNIDGTPIEFVHPADQPNPLNVLLLSEGFINQTDFKDFVTSLTERFLHIPPFSSGKRYINILSAFIPSNEAFSPSDESTIPVLPGDWNAETMYNQGDRVVQLTPQDGLEKLPELRRVYVSKTNSNVGNKPPHSTWDQEDPWRTVFTLHRREGLLVGRFALEPLEHWRPVRIVRDLQLPKSIHVPEWLRKTTADVWLNPRSKSFGAICIVANTTGNSDLKNYALWAPETEVDQEVREYIYQPVARYFVMDMYGSIPLTFAREDGTDFQLQGGYEHVFAHELCHSLAVGDEYITRIGDPPATLTGIDQARSRNIVYSRDRTKAHLTSDTFFSRLPWRGSMSLAEIQSGERLFRRDRLMAIDQDFYSGDFEIAHYEKVPGTNKPVLWSETYIIEGAGYKHNFFRSNFECKMRHGLYGHGISNSTDRTKILDQFKSKATSGHYEFGSPEFCHVCNRQIWNQITGFKSKVYRANRQSLETQFYKQIMPRLNKSFRIESWLKKKTISTTEAFCHIASVRAYIMLQQPPVSTKTQFTIAPLHVSLFYHGIYLDPTFFDFWRVNGDKLPPPSDPKLSDLCYINETDDLVPFTRKRAEQGFLGSREDVQGMFSRFRLRFGSFGNRVFPEYTPTIPEEIFETIYRTASDLPHGVPYGDEAQPRVSAQHWNGPEGPKQPWFDESDGRVKAYVDAITNEWSRWMLYQDLSDSERDVLFAHLRPLDMRLSLQYVMSLREKD